MTRGNEAMQRPDQNNFDATGLDWQAACYVWGEMDSQQQAAFEQRLIEDAAACAAVARAVELSDSLAAACVPVVAPHAASHVRLTACEATVREAAAGNPARFRRRRTWSQRIVWMSVGAAACLAVVHAGQSWLARHGGAPFVQDEGSVDEVAQIATSPADDASSSLALAWTESPDAGAELWPDAYLSPVLPAPIHADGPNDSDTRIEADSPMTAELTAPDWLLAAVAGATDDVESPNSRPPDGTLPN